MNAQSFAFQHVDLSSGWRAVPRWFRATDFWRSLDGAHRAVLDELYHRIAALPTLHRSTKIPCDRGQWVMSIEELARASGTTQKQARLAVEKAKQAGVISATTIVKKVPGRTLHISRFTWVDFDSYDRPDDVEGKPEGIPEGKPEGKPKGKVRHELRHGFEDTSGKTQGEEDGAAPLAGFAGDLPPGEAALVITNGDDDPGGVDDGQSPEGLDQSSVVGIVESKPVAKKTGKARSTGKGKASPAGAGLTAEEKSVVLQSVEAMEGYLLWGSRSLRGGDSAGLIPEGTNWRQYGGTQEDPKAELWDIRAFAGYYWWRVSRYRAKRSIPLTLPAWGRLMGDLRNLLATMTNQDLHALIGVVVSHFDLIVWMCRNAGQTMALNEASLSHGLVKSTAANIAQMSDEQRGQKYAELRAAYGIDQAAA